MKESVHCASAKKTPAKKRPKQDTDALAPKQLREIVLLQRDMIDSLIERIKKLEERPPESMRICNHYHCPKQHGSDWVTKYPPGQPFWDISPYQHVDPNKCRVTCNNTSTGTSAVPHEVIESTRPQYTVRVVPL